MATVKVRHYESPSKSGGKVWGYGKNFSSDEWIVYYGAIRNTKFSVTVNPKTSPTAKSFEKERDGYSYIGERFLDTETGELFNTIEEATQNMVDGQSDDNYTLIVQKAISLNHHEEVKDVFANLVGDIGVSHTDTTLHVHSCCFEYGSSYKGGNCIRLTEPMSAITFDYPLIVAYGLHLAFNIPGLKLGLIRGTQEIEIGTPYEIGEYLLKEGVPLTTLENLGLARVVPKVSSYFRADDVNEYDSAIF